MICNASQKELISRNTPLYLSDSCFHITVSSFHSLVEIFMPTYQLWMAMTTLFCNEASVDRHTTLLCIVTQIRWVVLKTHEFWYVPIYLVFTTYSPKDYEPWFQDWLFSTWLLNRNNPLVPVELVVWSLFYSLFSIFIYQYNCHYFLCIIFLS